MPRVRDEKGRFAPMPGAGKRKSASPRKASVALVQAGPDRESDSFQRELEASWRRHGAAAIEEVRVKRPQDYMRLMASELPGPSDEKSDPIEAMSDDEVADELRRILQQLAAAGFEFRP